MGAYVDSKTSTCKSILQARLKLVLEIYLMWLKSTFSILVKSNIFSNHLELLFDKFEEKIFETSSRNLFCAV
jgi:hypothetical protein